MGFKFNALEGTFDIDSKLNLTNPLQFKGAIAVNTDFPLIADVETGWFYTVTADVTDDAGVLYTNTGQSFEAGDEIAWNGTDWTELGSTELWSRAGTVLSPKNVGDDILATGNIEIAKTGPNFKLHNTASGQTEFSILVDSGKNVVFYGSDFSIDPESFQFRVADNINTLVLNKSNDVEIPNGSLTVNGDIVYETVTNPMDFNVNGSSIFHTATDDNIILHSNSGNSEIRVRADNGSVSRFQINSGEYRGYHYGDVYIQPQYSAGDGIIQLGTAGKMNYVNVIGDLDATGIIESASSLRATNAYGTTAITGHTFTMGRNGQNYITASQAYGAFHFRTGGGGDKMIITYDGKVGIGANPSSILHVEDTAPQLVLKATESTQGRSWVIGKTSDDTAKWTIGTPWSSNYDMVLGTNEAGFLRLMTDDTERMRILATGNIGIGLDNPTYSLVVKHATDNTLLALQSDDANAGMKLIDSTKEVDIENRAGKLMIFTNSGANNPFIFHEDKLSIGRPYTHTPSASLEVDGNIKLYGTDDRLYFVNTGEGIYAPSAGIMVYETRGFQRVMTDTNNNDPSTAEAFSIYTADTYAGGSATQLLKVLKNKELQIGGTLNCDSLCILDAGFVGTAWKIAGVTYMYNYVDTSAAWNNLAIGDNVGNQLVITNEANRNKDHHHDPQTDPTLYVHSDSDVDADATEWISLTHNKTNGVINLGSGYLDIQGTLKSIGTIKAISTKTGAYTTLGTDEVILGDTSGGDFTITLIAASNTGQTYSIKNISTGTLTVDGNASEEIDGELTIDLIEDETITIISDGSNWFII